MTAIFSASREKASSELFKATASEVLQVFPLVRHFAKTIVSPTRKLDKEVKSLLNLCRVLDALLDAKQASSQTSSAHGEHDICL